VWLPAMVGLALLVLVVLRLVPGLRSRIGREPKA
jgi:hypothetical protein